MNSHDIVKPYSVIDVNGDEIVLHPEARPMNGNDPLETAGRWAAQQMFEAAKLPLIFGAVATVGAFALDLNTNIAPLETEAAVEAVVISCITLGWFSHRLLQRARALSETKNPPTGGHFVT